MKTNVWNLVRDYKNDIRSVTGDRGRWARFVNELTAEHFIGGDKLSIDKKRELFSSSVDLVEFEPNSFCNRLCTFCPNVVLDRRSKRIDLRQDIFEKALQDLSEISYRQRVRFALYSEPLASPTTVRYIDLARSYLPNAKIDVISNGDYLKPTLLCELRDAGLDILRISVYPKGYIWDKTEARKQLGKVAKRMGIKAELTSETDQVLLWRFPFENLTIVAGAKDIASTGFDRGGVMVEMKNAEYLRTSPCRVVFSHLNIYHDGAVTPCHNIRNDHPDHKSHIIDYLDGDKSLFDVYSSKKFATWRTHLSRVGGKGTPCNSCKQMVCESQPASWLLARKISRKLSQIGSN